QQALGFRIAWRTIRNHWYDASLNGLDWNAVLQRYEGAAGRAVDGAVFDRIVEMMFGELNGSHLGFLPGTFFGNPPVVPWRDETAHLGLVFDPFHEGTGWLVTHAIDGSPADRHDADLRAGDLILAVDGTVVTSEMDPTEVLNGDLNREIVLRIRRGQDKPVEKRLRPISYADARRLRHEEDVRENHRRVEKASAGKIGYVHVAHMQWPDFEQFEEEIHARGAGKDGLIIDVRDNGGGFTADHLLTVLCQPRHAWTVPRGGSPGYPGDRRVYASWDKPIVVLCNQNSFSNAEIFTHAIKTLQRGKVVGVPTAGGVVSTGSASILDIGMMRMPTRGWYTLKEGEDMELHPAVPDVILWPAPGELSRGVDRQLDKAIAVIQGELKTSGALSPPELHPATTRRAKP
ncbi:MAG: S41 family peptidase, partial [Verrucomicrobiales bacterium]